MFPITCNAVGDIILVVQLIRDIVVALNDARGAVEEYKHFIHVLKALGTVLSEVYDLAKVSQNESLRQAVLEEVQHCCIDINNAHNSITNFEKLEETPTRATRGVRAGLVLTKLRWHFMKASDAAKYAKRFSESHRRLNTYIGLLSHHSTSQLLGEHHYQALQGAYESRTLRQSAEEIKTVVLSAIQLQSRQQVTQQVLTRPFFASSSQHQCFASRVQRVTDMIIDHLAPDTPAAQREHFLSSLAPFLIAGAAFLVHHNVSSQWHSTLFLPIICALLVQVMWFQSFTPVHPGFDVENAIFLVDFFGDKIIVPLQVCHSYETFHQFLGLIYPEAQQMAKHFVQLRLYELYLGGTSQLISFSNWSHCILPGTCLEMGIVLLPDANSHALCPYCQSEHVANVGRQAICAACSARFIQTNDTWTGAKAAGYWAGASVLQRRHGTDFETELSQMNAPLTNSFSVAQFGQSSSVLPDGAVWRRCSRVHVVNISYYDLPYAPLEDIQSSSRILMDTLLSEKSSGRRRSPRYELMRAYIDLIEEYGSDWEPADSDLKNLRVDKSVFDDARQKIGDKQGCGQCSEGPITVEEKLLADMVFAMDAFIAEPSREGVRRWKALASGYSPEFLSLDESQRCDELLEELESIGRCFHRLCEHYNLQ